MELCGSEAFFGSSIYDGHGEFSCAMPQNAIRGKYADIKRLNFMPYGTGRE